jgi:hypothetical protein
VRWFYFWVAALFPLHFYEGFLFFFPAVHSYFLVQGKFTVKGAKVIFFFFIFKRKNIYLFIYLFIYSTFFYFPNKFLFGSLFMCCCCVRVKHFFHFFMHLNGKSWHNPIPLIINDSTTTTRAPEKEKKDVAERWGHRTCDLIGFFF